MKVNEHVGAKGQNSMPATTNVERKNEDLEDDVPVQREHFQICFCFPVDQNRRKKSTRNNVPLKVDFPLLC